MSDVSSIRVSKNRFLATLSLRGPFRHIPGINGTLLRAVKRSADRVVLYRKADGTPVAMDDYCPHRGYPLSKSGFKGAEEKLQRHSEPRRERCDATDDLTR
jgi:Rieske [2Fe-2S] domain